MTTTQTAPFSLRSIAVPAFGPALLFSIGEGAILPVVALSARDLGASVAVAALMVTLIGLGSWFFNLPASLITLKFGERWAIVGAAAASAVALAAAALAPLVPDGLWLLAAAMVVVGMAASVFSLARQKYLTEAVPVILRARALSTLGGVNRIGIFIGPFIGAAVMQFAGITGAYWVGVVAMAAAAAVSVTIPDLVADAAADDGVPVQQATLAQRRRVPRRGLPERAAWGAAAERAACVPAGGDPAVGRAPRDGRHAGIADLRAVRGHRHAGLLSGRKADGPQGPAMGGHAVDTHHGHGHAADPAQHRLRGLLLAALLIGFGNGISSGLNMTLGADFSPDNGRGQFLGIWRFMADAGATGGPVLLSAVTAVCPSGPGWPRPV